MLPSLVVLDYLLPMGLGKPVCDLTEQRRRIEEEEMGRYTGLLILEAFPEILPRTVAGSFASREAVERHPLAAQVPHYSKLELPFDWDDFEEKIRSIYEAAS